MNERSEVLFQAGGGTGDIQGFAAEPAVAADGGGMWAFLGS